MKKKSKNITTFFGLILIGIFGAFIYFRWFFNPFDFGPCDGEGKPNRYEKYFYNNGQLEKEGQIRDCYWHGLIRGYYETGELKSEEKMIEGRRHGISKVYYRKGDLYKKEEYNRGELMKFEIYSQNSMVQYQYDKMNQIISVKNRTEKLEIAFTDSLVLSGYDEPYTMLIDDDLVLRGKKDFYLVDSNLKIKIDLRDSLMKYIPTSFDEKIDLSGNSYDFEWKRIIEGDSIRVKVFYIEGDSQFMNKTWERKYKII